MHATRLRCLQALGIFCGFAAGAWLGGAEAPIKLVNPDISPITVSLIMVFGVFLARWSVPAFIRGTSHVRNDVRQAPHLVVWADARRMHVGRRQHAHDLRHPQRRPQHRLSPLEHEQPARHLLGISALQRTALRRMEALARRSRRRTSACSAEPHCWRLHRRIRPRRAKPRSEFSPRSAPAFSGERCTSPTARPISPE